jgi:hypothetical protein
VMSVTDLEIEEAIREAWTILYAGAPPSARRLAAALLAVTGGTQAHPHWDCRDFGGGELSRVWRVGCFIGWGSGTAWVLCLVGIGDDTPPT